MQTRITSRKDLLAFRDRLRKALDRRLSIRPRESKVNELAAAILGARDFNTALGMLDAPVAAHCSFDRNMENEVRAAPTADDFLLSWGAPDAIENRLLDLVRAHAPQPKRVMEDIQAFLSLLLAALCHLRDRSELIMSSFALRQHVSRVEGLEPVHELAWDEQFHLPSTVTLPLRAWLESDAQDVRGRRQRQINKALRKALPHLVTARDRQRAVEAARIIHDAPGQAMLTTHLQGTAYLLEATGHGALFSFRALVNNDVFCEELDHAVLTAVALDLLRTEELAMADGWGLKHDLYRPGNAFQAHSSRPGAAIRSQLIGETIQVKKPVVLAMAMRAAFMLEAGRNDAWAPRVSYTWPGGALFKENINAAYDLYCKLMAIPVAVPLPPPGKLNHDSPNSPAL